LNDLKQDKQKSLLYVTMDLLIIIFICVSVPHELQKMRCHKIKTIDVAVLLAEAMRRIHNKESLSYLFKNVTLED